MPEQIERLAYAVAYLHVSPDTLRRMASDGKLPGSFKIGQKWLLNPKVFHQWLSTRSTQMEMEMFTEDLGAHSGKFDTSRQMVEKYENLLAAKAKKKPKKY